MELTAKHLLQNLTINRTPQYQQALGAVASSLSDSNLRQYVSHGIGVHHAGMSPDDRRAIENHFRNGGLPLLITTSTLAMGVNLPAHLVIVKSTKHYSNGEYQDYPESMILQMIGRAGRPQFDTHATAVILTTAADKVS